MVWSNENAGSHILYNDVRLVIYWDLGMVFQKLIESSKSLSFLLGLKKNHTKWNMLVVKNSSGMGLCGA